MAVPTIVKMIAQIVSQPRGGSDFTPGIRGRSEVTSDDIDLFVVNIITELG